MLDWVCSKREGSDCNELMVILIVRSKMGTFLAGFLLCFALLCLALNGSDLSCLAGVSTTTL